MPARPPAPSWIRPVLLAANYGAPVILIGTLFRYPWLIAAAIIVHACFFYAIVTPSCGWLVPVVTRFEPNGREVWLTIDDGPAGEASRELAAEMARRGTRATFFVKGENLTRDPGAAHALLAAGHTLANHTHTHPAPLFWLLRPGQLRREIDQCAEALRRAGVVAQQWFRPPVGLKNVYLASILRERGLRLIAWTVRSGDTANANPETVARRVRDRAFPGAIILLHEARAHSNETILQVIDDLRAAGYTFVIPADEQLTS